MSRQKHRQLTCPRCGAEVKIPLFWAIGIEGIFRCPNCRMPFKTGYKMGAIFMALALTLAVTTVQLLVYLFSIYSMVLFVLALIPLWLFYGYHFRKPFMLHKAKRYAAKHPIEEELNPDEETAPKRSLPKDVAFDDDTSTHSAPGSAQPAAPATATDSNLNGNPDRNGFAPAASTVQNSRNTEDIAPKFGAGQDQDYRF